MSRSREGRLGQLAGDTRTEAPPLSQSEPRLRIGSLALALMLPTVGIGMYLLHNADDPYMGYAVGGAGVLSAVSGFPRRLWLLVAPLGLAFAWGLPHETGWLAPIAAGVGIASLIVGGLALPWLDREVARNAIWAAIYPVGIAFAIVFRQAAAPRHLSYDLYAAAADEHLFGPVAFNVGRWFQAHPWIAAFHLQVYDALPFGMAVAFARTPARKRWPLVALFVLAGVAGLVCYRFIPIGGPLAALPSFPSISDLPPVRPTVLPAWAELTGFPSLHFAWALLVAGSIWDAGPWARAISVMFVVTTAIATLGLGMHWLVDLVAAIPFSWTLWKAMELVRKRSVRGPRVKGMSLVW